MYFSDCSCRLLLGLYPNGPRVIVIIVSVDGFDVCLGGIGFTGRSVSAMTYCHPVAFEAMITTG
ncbi:MAG: hypothetical protein PHD11_00290 [Bacteroidales bacterium]|nr:hypothetical protein [Bacteroidales bacterium]